MFYLREAVNHSSVSNEPTGRGIAGHRLLWRAVEIQLNLCSKAILNAILPICSWPSTVDLSTVVFDLN
jgi:hypothetical protein